MALTQLSRRIGFLFSIGLACWLGDVSAPILNVQAQSTCSISLGLNPANGTASPGGTVQFSVVGQANGVCAWQFSPTLQAISPSFSVTFVPTQVLVSPNGQGTSRATVSVAPSAAANTYELRVVINLVKIDPSSSIPQPPVLRIFTLRVGGGGGQVPDIDVNPTSIDFGMVNVGTRGERRFTIRNLGQANLFINSIAIRGGSSVHFGFCGVAFSGFTLKPNEARELQVCFIPQSAGTFQDAILIRVVA